MEVLSEQYKRFQFHEGFPNGTFDPVFLQDKLSYLFAINEDDYLPTFKLDMPKVDDEDNLVISQQDADFTINCQFDWM